MVQRGVERHWEKGWTNSGYNLLSKLMNLKPHQRYEVIRRAQAAQASVTEGRDENDMTLELPAEIADKVEQVTSELAQEAGVSRLAARSAYLMFMVESVLLGDAGFGEFRFES